ncbi:methyltransferase domain-containing protein [Sneathiella chungangensis]|uniref:Methyltransferase domain-containing protein n=1 Tax=Sneathiella chungangensis TaxID=1418234 RepID=A0A845MCP6_9PROT|nr:class I SAM-dependent methyltransferase [Sneathiella chungangensis]MZR20957.1 methyltransferase domain-containing protein [Sneathiella chungangensis]
MALSMAELAKRTQDVYERNAARFDAERAKILFERNWLDKFLSHLPTGGHVLDLGCGSGDPIASYIIGQGYRLTGADASAAMLRLAREKFPKGDWRLVDMRSLELPERFDGIIGWDSFFHLTREEQRSVIPKLAAHLVPSGVLMLTVGPDDGEETGRVGDDAVYHASLSIDEYTAILASHDVTVIDFRVDDPDCGHHTILLAQKKATPDHSH